MQLADLLSQEVSMHSVVLALEEATSLKAL